MSENRYHIITKRQDERYDTILTLNGEEIEVDDTLAAKVLDRYRERHIQDMANNPGIKKLETIMTIEVNNG